jgi:hypothetical protein
VISRLKGELRDDLELKETLLKSSKENVGLLECQLVTFKEEVAKKDRVLAERDELLAAERKKAEFNAAKLKESETEIAKLKAQTIELKDALDAKDDEMMAELKEVGYDAYREAVKSIVFLNPSVELNLRGLDPFHGVKDGQFWDFHDHQIPSFRISPRWSHLIAILLLL